MLNDVERKLKKGNRILFSRDSECLRELVGLIEGQTHQTLIIWALDCAQKPLLRFEERYPQEHRARRAVEKCAEWASGRIKMPEAKRAILDAHAVAKEIDDTVCAALCHAIGHAGATVHVETHAVGLVFYELTAIVLENRNDGYSSAVQEKIAYYTERLLYWQNHLNDETRQWATFLQDDAYPNKKKKYHTKR